MLALFLLLAHAPCAASQDLPGAGFRADPLLQEQVQAITQGPDGRMWLATGAGLQVYDGYEAHMFRGAPGSVEPFPRGAVRTLFVDRRGRLWVGHVGGLVRIDPSADLVEHVYRNDPEDPGSLGVGDVTSIHEDRDGRIWVGLLNWQVPEAGGLYRLDDAERGFEYFGHDPADPASLSHNRVRTISGDSRGNLWIGTWHGLNRLRREGGGFDHYFHDPGDPSSLAYDDVMDLLTDATGSLWVATIGGGLDRYDPSTDAFEHVAWSGSPYLMALEEDDRGRLWVATLEDGLAMLAPGEQALRSVDLGPDAVRSPRIDALAVSRDGMLWLAGQAPYDGAGRILRMDLRGPVFTYLDLPHVQAIAEGSDGDLWMGSRTRLVRVGPDASRTSPGRSYDCPDLGPASGLHWMSAIVSGPDGTLWLGYWSGDVGLCRLDPEADVPVPVRAEVGDGRSLTWVSDMTWWDGRLWLVSDGDLVAIDPADETADVVRGAPLVGIARRRSAAWGLVTDTSGDLWMSTIEGRLQRHRAETGEVEVFDAAVATEGWYDFAAINSIRPRPGGTLWLATDWFGLCEFDPALDKCVRTFGTEDGLPDDQVMDVLEDAEGRVWVATTDALSLLAPETGSVRNLLLPRAMRGSHFRTDAAIIGSDGTAWFGTSLGALAFPAGGAEGNTTPPVTRINRVETVGGGDLDVVRGVSEGGSRPLELASGRNDVVFEYVGIHYSDPGANRYAYQLEGLDETWRNVGMERRARFTNLDPGSYVFRVRSASANGAWSEAATFDFRILAPWWERPWALAIWVLLALAGVAAVETTMARRRRFAATLQREQAEARRLSELAATRSRLFANLSHEYRTPLALILGQIESARSDVGGGAGPPSRKLDMAERQTRELQRLTDELLELSRLEAGALELARRPGDVVPLLKGAVAAFHSVAETAGVALRLDVEGDPILVLHDPDRMRRVVTNLLSNALKFTPRGGEIVVRAGQAGAQVRLSVSDTGSGIPADSLETIFDRFRQVDTDRDRRALGSGIGLALVKELVELHEGSIRVESRVGEGTRFEILLPAIRGDELPVPLDEEPGGVEDRTDGDAPSREIVLLVDDHPDMRAFLRQELGDVYDIEEAVDGAAGLARAIELVPDLVITDVMMPRMDGYELVQRLRADERTSHVPIVMLTARTSDDARIAGLESGVDDYLPKPFSARVLRMRVRNLLEIRRLLRSRYAGEIWLKPEEVEAPSVDRKFLEKVARSVEERMADPAFTVEELAASVHMSRSQLHRKLTALLGLSPGALIRAMRLQRAADLIRSGSLQLGQIAYATGFSDQANFSRSFKKHFGCTPSAYRERPERAAGTDAPPP